MMKKKKPQAKENTAKKYGGAIGKTFGEYMGVAFSLLIKLSILTYKVTIKLSIAVYNIMMNLSEAMYKKYK